MSLRPVIKKLIPNPESEAEGESNVEESEQKEKVEERLFNPVGYEPHLVEMLEKDILQRNPNVTWNKVAGLNEAKTILQEAMVLPMLMPDYFKVNYIKNKSFFISGFHLNSVK